MPDQLMWWLSRATGLVAGMLLVASLVWGVLLATRALKPVDRPAWLLAVHRWFSALACIGVVLHMVTLVGDNYVHFGWRELFVPGGSPWRTVPIALGVVAFYLLVLVQGSSLMMKRLSKRTWRSIHLLSYAAVWLTMLHAAYAGTDVTNRLYQAVALFLTLAAVTAAIVRIVVGSTRQQAQAKNTVRVRGGGVEGALRDPPPPSGDTVSVSPTAN
jgi:DMSO/TMAO reductase YedYZ heme-binding membrane subunit